MTVGVLSVRVMTVGVLSVGVMTVGVLNVGVMTLSLINNINWIYKMSSLMYRYFYILS